MKNIAIALDAGTPLQRNEITKLFARNSWAYWHWIDDFWIVQVPDNYTPETLHDEIEGVPNIGTPSMLLFEFRGEIKFWGRSKEDAWNWLKHIGKAG